MQNWNPKEEDCKGPVEAVNDGPNRLYPQMESNMKQESRPGTLTDADS